ncbi:MAG: site-2 protease family protein [Desulfurococcales archaeon]|nr:site-2 protease family protein [Desulfurococcales archaeon]
MPFTSRLEACLGILRGYYEILEAKPWRDGILIKGVPVKAGYSPVKLYSELSSRGCVIASRREGGLISIYLGLKRGNAHGILALALGLIMVLTLYLSGLVFSRVEMAGKTVTWSPWEYVIGLLVPLMLHELGHYATMRYYKVPSSFPIPLPGPPAQLGFLGTFGSIILMRWAPPTAEALALVGIAGPLIGFVAALPLAYVGLQHSLLVSLEELGSGTVPIPFSPLVFILLMNIIGIPVDKVVVLSPLAFASFVMFFVTFLNLLPIGQLDGGHVVRAALGQKGHSIVSRASLLILFASSIFYPQLTLFAVLALLLYIMGGSRHPGPAFPEERLGVKGQVASILYVALLILTLPVPS